MLDAAAAASPGDDFAEAETPAAFENIETGVLEHDRARHEAALLEETEEGEVLDLGRVEGLSAAPSTLAEAAHSDQATESQTSDTMRHNQ